ncbi:MAG TPA: glycosyltransferase family 2 protein [Chitinophagaceae bacterium]|nr:glycosyltransferase family 2 protein [Chitinophagaceae bacterium]
MKLSIVITLYNEEDNIKPLLARVKESVVDCDYELVLVDDGSSDKTIPLVKKYAYEQVKLVELNKNYGQTTAMSAGIREAKGKYIVTLDGDLQNDPKDIPMLLEKAEKEDWDVVAGRRANRQDIQLKKIPSRIANGLIRAMTDVRLHDYGCTLKLFRQDIAKGLGLYGEMHRFIPVLAAMQGARMTEVDVQHHARIHGESKYGIGRTFKVISDLLFIVFFQKYFQRPMHLFGPPGILFFFIGLIINIYLLIVKLGGADIGDRPLLILGLICLLGGLQIILFGFLAEVLMRIYYESQAKINYKIKRIFQVNASDS